MAGCVCSFCGLRLRVGGGGLSQDGRANEKSAICVAYRDAIGSLRKCFEIPLLHANLRCILHSRPRMSSLNHNSVHILFSKASQYIPLLIPSSTRLKCSPPLVSVTPSKPCNWNS